MNGDNPYYFSKVSVYGDNPYYFSRVFVNKAITLQGSCQVNDRANPKMVPHLAALTPVEWTSPHSLHVLPHSAILILVEWDSPHRLYARTVPRQELCQT